MVYISLAFRKIVKDDNEAWYAEPILVPSHYFEGWKMKFFDYASVIKSSDVSFC